MVELEDDGDDEEGDVNALLPPAAGPAVEALAAVNQTAIVDAMHAAERKLPNPLLPVLLRSLGPAVRCAAGAPAAISARPCARAPAPTARASAEGAPPVRARRRTFGQCCCSLWW